MGNKNKWIGMVKERRRERWEKFQRAAMGTVAVGSACLLVVSVNLYQDRKITEAAIAARYEGAGIGKEGEEAWADGGTGPALARVTGENLATPDVDPDDLNLVPFLNQQMVSYQGKQYRRNTYIKALLCMGVDRSGAMDEEKEPGSAGQADGLFLIAQDEVRNTLKILMIPRDTMTEITFRSADGNRQWQDITQLTVAFAYGNGKEGSCLNVVGAVEGLLGGFEIDHYIAADTNIISMLNDAVGGVTVTIPTKGMEVRDPAFVQGSRVTLLGSQAEAFVRFRDTGRDYSALDRMDQQQEYITQFFQAVKGRSRENSQIVPQLFELVQDYMVTDMGKEAYLKTAMDVLEGGLGKEDFYTLPGMEMTTELYDIYRADREAAVSIVLNLFYREV